MNKRPRDDSKKAHRRKETIKTRRQRIPNKKHEGKWDR